MSLPYETASLDLLETSLDQYMAYVKRTSRLMEEEVFALLSVIDQGKRERFNPQPDTQVLTQAQQARDRLVEHFQALIVSIAGRYARLRRSLELLDLVQEGNIGLLCALEQCDLSKVRQLSSYVYPAIRGQMIRAIYCHDSIIRLPQEKYALVCKVRRARATLMAVSGTEPSVAMMAQQTGLSELVVREVLVCDRQVDVSSIDRPLTPDEDAGDYYYSAAAPDMTPSELTYLQHLRPVIEQWLTYLTAKQRLVMQLRYGLREGDERGLSWSQVSHELGLSIRSLQNHEQKGKAKLRQMLALSSHGVDGVQEVYLTSEQAAQRLGVSRPIFYTYVRMAALPSHRIEGMKGRLYRQCDIDGFSLADWVA